MRLFVAAEVPGDLRMRLEAVQKALKDAPLPVRWARPEGIHLTLKFLGQAAETRLGEIGAAIAEAGRDIEPFRLEAAEVTAFPARGAPRLIWTEVRGDVGAARRLAAAIDEAAGRIGFARETREFTPHITLGRVKGAERGPWRELLARVAGRVAAGLFDVDEYVMFESRTGPGGSIYLPLRRFPLAGGAGRARAS